MSERAATLPMGAYPTKMRFETRRGTIINVRKIWIGITGRVTDVTPDDGYILTRWEADDAREIFNTPEALAELAAEQQ